MGWKWSRLIFMMFTRVFCRWKTKILSRDPIWKIFWSRLLTCIINLRKKMRKKSKRLIINRLVKLRLFRMIYKMVKNKTKSKNIFIKKKHKKRKVIERSRNSWKRWNLWDTRTIVIWAWIWRIRMIYTYKKKNL